MEQLDTAIKLTRELCANFAQSTPDIPEDDLIIIRKYEELGYISLKRTRGNKSKGIYYPTIQAKEFSGIAYTIWVATLNYAMEEAGIKSQLSKNSVATYTSQAWRYDIEPVIVPNGQVGTVTINKQLEHLKEVFNK